MNLLISKTGRLFRLLYLASVLLLVFGGSPELATAQQPKISAKKLAVDSLKHKQQTILGLVLDEQNKDGDVVIAVDRKWLAETYPNQMETYEKDEADYLAPILDEYDARFDTWSQEHKDKPDLAPLLESHKEEIRFKNTGDQLKKKKFILLRLTKTDVSSLYIQPYKRKRIAALAWANALDNVSTRSLKELTAALKEKKIDIKNESFDLSGLMSATRLTDRQWNIRKAMYEMWNFGEMEFQGEGEMLFHKSEAKDIGKLVGSMMGGSSASQLEKLGRELGLPEFTQRPEKPKNDWKTGLTKKADAAGFRSIVVKRIVESNATDQVDVEAVFMAKISDTQWETIKTFRGSARFADQTQADLDALDADAQIQKAIAAVKALGLGDDALLRTALQRGAATQSALKSVTLDLDYILDWNSRNLSGPIHLNR